MSGDFDPDDSPVFHIELQSGGPPSNTDLDEYVDDYLTAQLPLRTVIGELATTTDTFPAFETALIAETDCNAYREAYQNLDTRVPPPGYYDPDVGQQLDTSPPFKDTLTFVVTRKPFDAVLTPGELATVPPGAILGGLPTWTDRFDQLHALRADWDQGTLPMVTDEDHLFRQHLVRGDFFGRSPDVALAVNTMLQHDDVTALQPGHVLHVTGTFIDPTTGAEYTTRALQPQCPPPRQLRDLRVAADDTDDFADALRDEMDLPSYSEVNHGLQDTAAGDDSLTVTVTRSPLELLAPDRRLVDLPAGGVLGGMPVPITDLDNHQTMRPEWGRGVMPAFDNGHAHYPVVRGDYLGHPPSTALLTTFATHPSEGLLVDAPYSYAPPTPST